MSENKNLITLSIKDDNKYVIRPYYICTTIGENSIKSVEWPGFNLAEGAIILIKFKYSNTSTDEIKLSINDGEPRPIYYRGNKLANSKKYWENNDIIELRYNGSEWEIIGTLNMDIFNIDKSISNLESQIKDLQSRLSALENK